MDEAKFPFRLTCMLFGLWEGAEPSRHRENTPAPHGKQPSCCTTVSKIQRATWIPSPIIERDEEKLEEEEGEKEEEREVNRSVLICPPSRKRHLTGREGSEFLSRLLRH